MFFIFYRSPPRFQRSRETIGLILSRCRISPISRGGEKKKRNTAPSPVLPICPYSSTPHFSLTYYRLLLLNLTKIRAPRVLPTHSFSTCHTPIFPILREYNITGLIFNFVQKTSYAWTDHAETQTLFPLIGRLAVGRPQAELARPDAAAALAWAFASVAQV